MFCPFTPLRLFFRVEGGFQGTIGGFHLPDPCWLTRGLPELCWPSHVGMTIHFQRHLADLAMVVFYSGEAGFRKVTGYIEKAKQTGGEILFGGSCESSYSFGGPRAQEIPLLCSR
jgi:hypothetical protein